ncbi:MAG: SOS response-associated peptidase family protein [Lachnospiraceae bacterium]|nr:SOS response-associated peptidase family protein [Lachnospiraceae bacterium]
MCGRYEIYQEIKDEQLEVLIRQALRTSGKICANMKPAGEIRPTDIAPVIAPSALNRRIGAFPMRWGFAHPTRGMLVFNTRMETAPEKDLFVSSIDERRCLIPASRYFEWKKVDAKRKVCYAIGALDRQPLYLAGLYIRTSDEHRLPCFSILTQEAEKSIRDVHPRMPVLVPFSRAEEWLSPDTDFHEFIYNLSVPVEAKVKQ